MSLQKKDLFCVLACMPVCMHISKSFLYFVSLSNSHTQNTLKLHDDLNLLHDPLFYYIQSCPFQKIIYFKIPTEYMCIRRPVPSTDQAIPSCFYFRISWILMEQRCFYFFCPLGFLQGLRSLKHWLLQKLSMKNLDQKFKFLIKK